jgi:hypothetical protein
VNTAISKTFRFHQSLWLQRFVSAVRKSRRVQAAVKAVFRLRRKSILALMGRSVEVARRIATIDVIMNRFRLGRILKCMAALVRRRDRDVVKARAVMNKIKARRFFAKMRGKIAAKRKSEECVARVKR